MKATTAEMTEMEEMEEAGRKSRAGITLKPFWRFCQRTGLKNLCKDPSGAMGDEFQDFYDPKSVDSHLSKLKQKELPIFCTERRSPPGWCLTARGPVEAIFGRRGRPVLEAGGQILIMTGASRHDGEVYLTLETPSGVVESSTTKHLTFLGAKYVGIAVRNDRGRYNLHLRDQ